VISLTLSLNNVFALNKFSGSLELKSHREALSILSDGKSTITDWNLFATRSYATLSGEEKHTFRHAIRLFPSKDEASSYNEERLRELGFRCAYPIGE
ncbi:hypothetical protein MKW92_041983, partial [Papaver armeniacum]